MTRLAVLGSPIGHSRSPQLHAAAYRELGLDWEYGRSEVRSGDLAAFIGGLDPSWRGLSLTMPLKREVLPLLDERDELTELTGAANTVLLAGGTRTGFNTDVGGIEAAFAERGVPPLSTALVLGGGATAASVLVALARLGVTSVTVAVRDPGRAEPLVELAAAVGVQLAVAAFGAELPATDLLASTLPGDAPPPPLPAPGRAALLDVAYDPWPSRLADGWAGPVVNGLDMLLHQALLQVRVFVNGDPGRVLDGEAGVLRAMRAAVGGF
ncbi:shikimate dehydrogenase [Naasia aerilata]|uniref:Shikimate 5-dehydrogenase n=1 Tax=Naasia aerilata TaxID=1162966 RepID=A0ABM8GF48_9MICO|nr:shikimate dehydrogenase [Naasia aerilata]BDZ46955.1 shikimate 5-dehydrogenase [Naasia aerilata]